jgi:hypothetical protein
MYLPLIATLVWLGGLLALIGLWAAAGKPRYKGDEASVVSRRSTELALIDQVFISDVGAAHKTLFICICCITSAFYISSLFAERWLRHVDRLPTDLRRREKVFGAFGAAWNGVLTGVDWLAIFFCIVGSAGLILLSIVSCLPVALQMLMMKV